jgi:hypothetical protein
LEIMNSNKVDKRKLRSFGWIVASGFAVIALFPALLRGQSPRTWALAISLVLSGTALVFPPALKPFHRVWMTIGEALGWVNTQIILSLVYYVLIVPIGAIHRLTGKDAMRRNFEPAADTYKTPRTGRPPSHMQRQY